MTKSRRGAKYNPKQEKVVCNPIWYTNPPWALLSPHLAQCAAAQSINNGNNNINRSFVTSIQLLPLLASLLPLYYIKSDISTISTSGFSLVIASCTRCTGNILGAACSPPIPPCLGSFVDQRKKKESRAVWLDEIQGRSAALGAGAINTSCGTRQRTGEPPVQDTHLYMKRAGGLRQL